MEISYVTKLKMCPNIHQDFLSSPLNVSQCGGLVLKDFAIYQVLSDLIPKNKLRP